MTESIAKTLQGYMRSTAQSQQAQQNHVNQPSQQQPQQQPPHHRGAAQGVTAPLSMANVEKQTQALKQVRAGGQAGPAAPTTAQPPMQLGAQNSPTGKPTYFNAPALTVEKLQPPPKKKHKKEGGQTKSPPANAPSVASPQMLTASPDLRRHVPAEAKAPQPPPRQQYPCPEADCEYHGSGFATEELCNSHVFEEHTKPRQDPFKFVQESLAASLGLDAQGNPRPVSETGAHDVMQSSAAPMAATGSKQGFIKQELGATPMARDLSMKRQQSAAPMPGKPGLTNRSDNTPRPSDIKPSMATPQESEAPQQSMAIREDPWASSTIDPQTLFANMGITDVLGGGIFSDLMVYRSLTPNDTPESSKDSGVSEPNSDVSENAMIDIDMNWQPVDENLLVGMGNFGMGGGHDSLESDMFGAVGMDPMALQGPNWDEVPNDFSKPFQVDPALYSLDV